MADISVVRRRGRAYIMGLTDAGKHWLFTNRDGFQSLSSYMIDIPEDVSEEFIETLKAAGLEVD